MATVIGISGAWKDVQSRLKMVDVAVSHPDEIQNKLQELKQNRSAYIEVIKQTLAEEIQTLKKTIEQCELQLQKNIQLYQKDVATAIERLDDGILQSRKIVDKKIAVVQKEIDEQIQELTLISREQVPAKIEREVSQIIKECEAKLIFLEKQSAEVATRFVSDLAALEQQQTDLHQDHPNHLQQLDETVVAIEKEYQIDSAKIVKEIETLQATLEPQILQINEQTQVVKQEKVGLFKRIANWFKILFLYRQQRVISAPLRQLKTAENAIVSTKNRKIKDVMQQRQKIIASYHEQLENITYRKSDLLASKRAAIQNSEKQRIEINREKSDRLDRAKQNLLTTQQNKIERLRQRRAGLLAENESEVAKFKKQQQDLRLKEIEEIQRFRDNCQGKRIQLNYLLCNQSAVIHERCWTLDNTISALENVLKSHEFIGAKAELSLISGFDRLPPVYYALNDVRLNARRYVKFNHKAVQSAQVDHLIVAPTGVFVVEVKHWSQQFSDSGNFFDPYEQLGRSSYLCYCLLKENFGIKMTVRSILAYRGHLPPPSENSKYIKVLPIEEVTGYVRWFERQTPVLSAVQVENIVKEFHPQTSHNMSREVQPWEFI